MRLDFLKMQGLGNDFLVFDAPQPTRRFVDSNKLRALADRQVLMMGNHGVLVVGDSIAQAFVTATQ